MFSELVLIATVVLIATIISNSVVNIYLILNQSMHNHLWLGFLLLCLWNPAIVVNLYYKG